MGLVTLKEILSESIDKKYAVGAFDTLNPIMTEAILCAAEEEQKPLILMQIDAMLGGREDHDSYFKCIHDMIGHTTVPICLMLDHGSSYENCMKAIHYGFSAVMFDGSMLPYEENVKQTREIVHAAHACGVSVEAEIGHVGGLEADEQADPDGCIVDVTGYSNPDLAKRFAEETEIDAMAIAFGTVHGKYKGTPKLDYDRVAKIRSMVEIPLVMHGGSGVPEEGFREAVVHGISKVNICTSMIQAASEKMTEAVNRGGRGAGFPGLCAAAQEAVTEDVKKHMHIFGTQPLEIKRSPMRFGEICPH